MAPRARVALVVGVVSVAAAGATVGGALVQGRDTGGEVHGQTATTGAERAGPPALELAILDRDDAEARSLREAERLLEEGRVDEALARFEALAERNEGSVEAAVGAAVASWPDGTVERLEEVVEDDPASGVARLNLGLALLAEGDAEGAREQWSEAKRRDPDSAPALRAEDLLHPDSPPGRPRFVPRRFPAELGRLRVERRLAELRRRAERGGAREWVLYGGVLEQAGRRISAQRAYDRAVELDPESLDARVAAAVSRFDKDDPSQAFGRLGPLAAGNPRAAVVRYHLGLMLLWLPNLEGAREQLERARAADPTGFYGRQAARVLQQLDEAE
jgi:tetratricopeptide (TPR) repeat protein